MKTSKISDDWGLTVTPTENESILDLQYNEIVSLFERYGVLLFRGFELTPEALTTVTNCYTEKYSGDALRRPSRYGQKAVHDVDYSGLNVRGEIVGGGYVDWHSENGFAPTWPEVVWFYCNVPPKKGGKTIICDGALLWNNLSVSTKSFFLASPIRYQLEIPVGDKRPGKGKQPWFLGTIGTGDCYIDWETGLLHATQLRFAVQEGRSSSDLYFANHLFINLDSEPQLISRTMADGQQIPEDILEEIKNKADDLTYEHSWEKRDFLMVDNRRFLHGRHAYKTDDPREILQIQSERVNFGYRSPVTRSKMAQPN
jgi:alpha-ketoglutarate-dependent taurine dioxygenase